MNTGDRMRAVIEHGNREKVLDAIAAALLEHGYEETTMGGLAQRSGLTVGEVCELYATKQDVFVGLLERNARVAIGRVEQARQHGRTVSPWTARLRLVVEAFFEGSASDPHAVRAAVMQADALSNIDRRVRSGLWERWAAAVEVVTGDIAADEGFEPLTHGQAITVVAGFYELMARVILGDRDDESAALRGLIDETTEMIARLLRGGTRATP